MLILIIGILFMGLVVFSNDVVVIVDPINDFIASFEMRYIKDNTKAQSYLQQRTQPIYDSFPVLSSADNALDRTLLGGVWVKRQTLKP